MIGDSQSVGAQEVGEHRRRRRGVGERVVVVGQRDPVAGAQLGQAVGELAIGVESAGEVEGAHPPLDDESERPSTPRGTLDELGVEVGVVGGEHAAVEPAGELDEGGAQPSAPCAADRREMPWMWRGPTRCHQWREADEGRSTGR